MVTYNICQYTRGEIKREGLREMRDGDRGEQRKRRIGLHSLLHVYVLCAEGGDCWWFGHTVYGSCDISLLVSSEPIIG